MSSHERYILVNRNVFSYRHSATRFATKDSFYRQLKVLAKIYKGVGLRTILTVTNRKTTNVTRNRTSAKRIRGVRYTKSTPIRLLGNFRTNLNRCLNLVPNRCVRPVLFDL